MGRLSKPENISDISDRGAEQGLSQRETELVLGKAVHLMAVCPVFSALILSARTLCSSRGAAVNLLDISIYVGEEGAGLCGNTRLGDLESFSISLSLSLSLCLSLPPFFSPSLLLSLPFPLPPFPIILLYGLAHP